MVFFLVEKHFSPMYKFPLCVFKLETTIMFRRYQLEEHPCFLDVAEFLFSKALLKSQREVVKKSIIRTFTSERKLHPSSSPSHKAHLGAHKVLYRHHIHGFDNPGSESGPRMKSFSK